MSPTVEAFPPVPDEIPILMEGDLEHVLGPTILPGADLWKPVTLNHDGHPKQVNLPVGFSGRELSEKECSLLLLAWEDMGVFKAGKYEEDAVDVVYRQYQPVFEVLPQTVSLADDFRCGPLHGLAARTAIGFLFVDATRRVSLLSSTHDSASFQQCEEDLKILHEAGYDMEVVRKAFKYNVKLHIQYCDHEIGQLPAAIQTADEKQAKEIQEMELREKKVALETQMAALAVELQQIEQKLEQEAVGFDLFPGLSKAELKERLLQRQREKEALETLMQD